MSSRATAGPAKGNVYALTAMAVIECGFCLLEFFMGSAMMKEGGRALITYLEGTSVVTPWQHALVNVIANALIILWSCWRLGNSLNIGPTAVLARLGLFRPKFSRVAMALVAVHTCGVAIMAAMQYFSGRWLFGTANYFNQTTGDFDAPLVLEMLVLAPVREEILFRGILFAIAYKRVGGLSPDAKRNVIALNSLVFGAVHLLNLFGARYTPGYIALQVTLGMLIGLFYSLRFMLSATVVEPIALHVTNNLLSSLLPLNTKMDLSDWLIAVPLCMTLVVYFSFLRYNWPALQERTPTNRQLHNAMAPAPDASGVAPAADADAGDDEDDAADAAADSAADAAPATANGNARSAAAAQPKPRTDGRRTKAQLKEDIRKRAAAAAASPDAATTSS